MAVDCGLMLTMGSLFLSLINEFMGRHKFKRKREK